MSDCSSSLLILLSYIFVILVLRMQDTYKDMSIFIILVLTYKVYFLFFI